MLFLPWQRATGCGLLAPSSSSSIVQPSVPYAQRFDNVLTMHSTGPRINLSQRKAWQPEKQGCSGPVRSGLDVKMPWLRTSGPVRLLAFSWLLFSGLVQLLVFQSAAAKTVLAAAETVFGPGRSSCQGFWSSLVQLLISGSPVLSRFPVYRVTTF